MVCTRKRLILCLTLLGLWLGVIWGNSLLHGELSTKVSGFFGWLINGFMPSANAGTGEAGHGFLRKVGHLTEFCLLGLLLSWLVRMTLKETRQHLWLPLLGGIGVACVDETIQFFVPGRACRITDVGIDTLGCALGIVIITLIVIIKNQKLKETKQ
jgi:VanZ family protein